MKCIIYGLSTIRQTIESYIKEDIEIIGYSDSFSDIENFNGKKFYKPKELLKIEFDVIVIAIETFVDCVDVEENLVSMGIKSKKIVPFYRFIKYTNILMKSSSFVDELLRQSLSVDGMIFGLSYGANAINPKYLKNKFYNFCRGSQDLYYTLLQIKYIKHKYKEKIHNLKYIILDMYTYTYFNYDVSLSKNALTFIYNNGFERDTHNLSNNKNYSLKHFKKVCKNLDKYEYEIFNKIINSKYISRDKNGYHLKSKYFNNVLEEEEIKRYDIAPMGYTNIQKNIYTNTEKENIKILDEIINEVLDINSEVKIYLVLIPRYKIKEDKIKSVESIWKDRFYNILENLKLKYNFEVLDFKEYEEISSVRGYYLDLEHLNYNGATRFTKLLSNKIE